MMGCGFLFVSVFVFKGLSLNDLSLKVIIFEETNHSLL